MKKTLLPLLLIILPALAATSANAKKPLKTIFSCTTTNGKQLAIYRQGKDYIYSFGRKGRKPELTFRNPKKKVAKESFTANSAIEEGWMLRSIWRETKMIHKGYKYNVIWRVFISSERDWDEAGVEVYKREWNNKHKFFYDGELVAKISCDRRYRFIHNPEVNDF